MGLPQVSEYAAFVADEIKREHALSGVGASL
jgi:hypothetical protein